MQVATPSVPLVARYIPDSHDPQHRFPSARELLYGTSAGTVVQLLMEADAARQGFTLPNTKKLGPISAIYSGRGIMAASVVQLFTTEAQSCAAAR
jgi:Bardet-Biedl syndrome 7 protein